MNVQISKTNCIFLLHNTRGHVSLTLCSETTNTIALMQSSTLMPRGNIHNNSYSTAMTEVKYKSSWNS